jgi:allantoin racemase
MVIKQKECQLCKIRVNPRLGSPSKPFKETPSMNDATTQRLLLINPNTSTEVTRRLTHFLQALLPNLVQLDAVTAQFGARYIACEASHAVAGHAVLDAWAHHLAENPAPDGVLIGCFGDPGLFALRQSSIAPVTGLAESAFIEAAARGDFAIVTGGERWRPMLVRLAQSLGFDKQLKHIEIVTPTGAELMADPEMAHACLTHACQSARAQGVQSIIIGGAGLAGYARKLQSHIDLPLIDSVEAGLRVLLQGVISPSSANRNGFEVQWQSMSAAMTDLENRSAR